MPDDVGTIPKPKMRGEIPTIDKAAMGKDTMGEMMTGNGSATLPVSVYPELAGVQEGSKITGNWEGTVQSKDEKSVTIAFDKMDLSAENSADRELERMAGKKKVSNEPVEEEGV